MLYDYIITNYQKDEPIFLAELPGKSRESVRQEMKKLTDEGKIERLYNGVYYRSYKTILGTKGKVAVEKFIQKNDLIFNQVIEKLIISYFFKIIAIPKSINTIPTAINIMLIIFVIESSNGLS